MIPTQTKSLQLVWAGLAVLLALLIACPVFGSTITVTNTNDSGAGSLRDAIASASDGDTIVFSLTYPATITVTTPLTFGASVTILGPAASSLSISGGNSVVVLIINSGATVAISGVTVKEGSSLLGGGIFNAGTLTLTDSSVSNNTIGTQLGAGILNAGELATLTLINSTVSGNFADHPISGAGAGIYNFQGTLTLMNSSVSSNFGVGTGSYDGGGILNDAGLATLTNSVVLGNDLSANAGGYARGGGISNINSGSLILTNSTVLGNFVSGIDSETGGGGISNGFPPGHGSLKLINSTVSGNSVSGAGGGGGIKNAGVATVINSTVSGNSGTVGASGGGIFNANAGGFATVTNSTIAGNSVDAVGRGGGIKNNFGTLSVKNSILANNIGGNCPLTVSGTNTSAGYNLSDDGTCASFLIQTGDLNNIPAGLDPGGLKYNGGPTATIALLATGAAVNAIPLSNCSVTTDQRGVPRPQGPACDIGAFEFFQSPFEIEAVETFRIIDAVQSLSLPPGTKRGLQAPLQAAVDSLNRGVTDSAIDQLGAFINQAIALVQGGVLTTEQAAPLIGSAQQIVQGLLSP